MRAHVGDRIVVASPTIDTPVRDGEITEVRGMDGSPPYMVLWADTGHSSLFFPGVDAHVSGVHESEPIGSTQSTELVAVQHARSWRVDINLFEDGADTTAHAVLVADAPRSFAMQGDAHRELTDVQNPEVGDEVAVARALRRLSDRLFERASAEVISVEGPHIAITK